MPPQTPPTPSVQSRSAPSGNADDDMLEPGEEIVTVVRRHPIGIIFIYIEAFIGILALVGLLIIVAPSFLSTLSGQAYQLFLAGVILAVALVALILFVATYVYRQSRLLITNRSLVQIIQRGLFNRKVSRLSMSNIEDVNAQEAGFLQTTLNYGTLNVETAGEMENFTFPYCPRPNFYADRIIEARQQYAQSIREDSEHQ